jgi:hypothetical protein
MDNWVIASTVSSNAGMAEKSNYPMTNLNDSLRSALAKWTWSESATLTLSFTLPAAQLVNGIALVDSNFSSITGTPSTTFSFYCKTDGSNYGLWNLKHYATKTGVERFYLGTPDSTVGTMPNVGGVPYSTLYQLSFNPSSWGNYGLSELSLGGVVFSYSRAVDIAAGATLQTNSGTRQAASFSGAIYEDVLPSFASGSFSVGPYTQTEFYGFQQPLAAWGNRPQIIDIHGTAASTDSGATTTAVNNSAAYYAKVGGETLASTALASVKDNRPSLSFVEARG